MVWVVLVLLVSVLGGVSTDPERINHVPICWNLPGNQIGQNYGGLLVKVRNVRR